jgi:bisanhydrobacterioruberin hydratase
MRNQIVRFQVFMDRHHKLAVLFFVVFYLVGTAGMLISATAPLFARLTPLALVLGFSALLIYHREQITLFNATGFGLVYLLGFAIEAIGVSSGLVFGEYAYGRNLGIKLFDTPLIIGLNWLFLVYASSAIGTRFNLHGAFSVVLPAGFMVVYDLVLEQVAGIMDMWYWSGDKIPVQNYIAWFMIALVFHLLFRLFRINTSNKVAPAVFIIQFLFFLTIMIFSGRP